LDKIIGYKMASKKSIEKFVNLKNIAVVGVSQKKGKFGNTVYKELKQKGYNVFAVNSKLSEFEGEKCFNKLSELNGKIEAVVIVVNGIETEKIVEEANIIGIKHIWMQQGSESTKAIEYCKENGINVIHNECILMFAEPVKSVHGFHKWLWKIFGKLPK